jgi:Trypsin-co-occurring domain 1
MTDVVRVPVEGGGFIIAEVDGGRGVELVAATDPADIPLACTSLEKAVANLRPVAQAVLDQLKELGPNEVGVELALKFSAAVGVVLAKSSGEGACKVTIGWKK